MLDADVVLLDVDVLVLGVVRRRAVAAQQAATAAAAAQFGRAGRDAGGVGGGRDLPHEGADLVEVALLLGPAALGAVHDGRGVRAGLVLLEVPVQVGLLPEAAVAERALEGLLLVVDVPHVPLEVGRDGEGPLAVLALVRLLPGVRPQVAGEIG